MPSRDSRIAVVIPCFHVANTVAAVVKQVPNCVWRIYLVNDGCPQHSASVGAKAESDRTVVLEHAENAGVGAATITGMKRAFADGADSCIKLNGDGQMDASRVPTPISPIRDGRAELAIGKAYDVTPNTGASPLLRSDTKQTAPEPRRLATSEVRMAL